MGILATLHTSAPHLFRWASQFGDHTPTPSDPAPADEAALLLEERSVLSTGLLAISLSNLDYVEAQVCVCLRWIIAHQSILGRVIATTPKSTPAFFLLSSHTCIPIAVSLTSCSAQVKGPLLSRVTRYLRMAVLEPLRNQQGQALGAAAAPVAEGGVSKPPTLPSAVPAPKPTAASGAEDAGTLTQTPGNDTGVQQLPNQLENITTAAARGPYEGHSDPAGPPPPGFSHSSPETLAAKARLLRQARVRFCIQIVSRTGVRLYGKQGVGNGGNFAWASSTFWHITLPHFNVGSGEFVESLGPVLQEAGVEVVVALLRHCHSPTPASLELLGPPRPLLTHEVCSG